MRVALAIHASLRILTQFAVPVKGIIPVLFFIPPRRDSIDFRLPGGYPAVDGKEGCSLCKFIPQFALLAICLALAGCSGGGGSGDINRLPVDADLLDRVMAEAISDCGARHAAGEIASHEARARCETEQGRAAVERHAQDYAFGDLAALLTARRIQLARRIDAGTIAISQAATLYTDFHAIFIREARVRERLHNGNRPFWEFNICEIEGNGLHCTAQIPTETLNRQVETEKNKCLDRWTKGEFMTAEARVSCVMDNVLAVFARGNIAHMDLSRLQTAYTIDIGRRYDAGAITLNMSKRRIADMVSQTYVEDKRRDRQRAAGNLNWRKRDCTVEGDLLVCITPTDSK